MIKESEVNCAAFNPDGRALIPGSHGDNIVPLVGLPGLAGLALSRLLCLLGHTHTDGAEWAGQIHENGIKSYLLM